ncbi:DUF167 domain-containing protein [Candidatus Finniella inopinata]|uniref:UPF0235 protein EQU50_03095 n=1 Tax=Candidatus Finniella inopinata TaxID=1696036 RepID=A0A4V2DZX6_9PROT|nr:DUF167 domain-containing protein [Candidatus Finniella inopinata]RZI46587.1 DUF167 domain-containing protein [Candidatus Finniella inopinata]
MDKILEFFDNKIPYTLTVRVTPKASANRLKAQIQEDGTVLIRAYLTIVPEDGKANKALLKMLAKELGLPLGAFEITHGLKSRTKTIRINI